MAVRRPCMPLVFHRARSCETAIRAVLRLAARLTGSGEPVPVSKTAGRSTHPITALLMACSVTWADTIGGDEHGEILASCSRKPHVLAGPISPPAKRFDAYTLLEADEARILNSQRYVIRRCLIDCTRLMITALT